MAVTVQRTVTKSIEISKDSLWTMLADAGIDCPSNPDFWHWFIVEDEDKLVVHWTEKDDAE